MLTPSKSCLPHDGLSLCRVFTCISGVLDKETDKSVAPAVYGSESDKLPSCPLVLNTAGARDLWASCTCCLWYQGTQLG